MLRTDFHFDLPPELIAQRPLDHRTDSRLLLVDGISGGIDDRRFQDFVSLLNPGDVLVFNDTRVIPARLFGEKETGGKIEVLVERLTGENTTLAHCRSSKSPKPGTRLFLEGEVEMLCTGRQGDLFELQIQGDKDLLTVLEACGRLPLPPYIEREADEADRDRYQTTYARHTGAVAAPTAGLHFDDETFRVLAERGVETAFVTLHVGAGTFQPVRVDNISEHRMHSEVLEVNEQACHQVNSARERGNRVIAVGTTSVRCLETAGANGTLKPFKGETDIFITPGYRFQMVDGLLTNFHLPESTLLMLVSAFAGYETIMSAYRHAVEQRYRFFSYGDAMFLATCA